MLDVTDQFVTARRRGPWPIEQVVKACADADGFPDLRVEWDRDSGEQWLRLFKTSMLLGLVWAPGPLVISVAAQFTNCLGVIFGLKNRCPGDEDVCAIFH